MVTAVREAEQALGEASYRVTEQEEASRIFRRSLFVVRDVAAGEIFDKNNLRSIRPGHGLAPRYLATALGRRATRTIKRGTPLSWELLGEVTRS
jgi:sialic acid synthase SpsE